jgi:hypothetical protein
MIKTVFALSILVNSIWAQTYFDPEQFEIIDEEYIL